MQNAEPSRTGHNPPQHKSERCLWNVEDLKLTPALVSDRNIQKKLNVEKAGTTGPRWPQSPAVRLNKRGNPSSNSLFRHYNAVISYNLIF